MSSKFKMEERTFKLETARLQIDAMKTYKNQGFTKEDILELIEKFDEDTSF
jgi:hypothetical protein